MMKNNSSKFGVRVYCLGEAMSDTFLKLEKTKIEQAGDQPMICLPYGEKINVSTLAHKGGGSGFNVSVGLARLGLEALLIANLGKDSEGIRLKEIMQKEKIDIKNVVLKSEFETKSAIIINGEDGDRTIFVYHGKGVLSYEMIDWDKIEDGSWFYLGPMPETAKDLINHLLEKVEEKKLKLVVNPGSVQVDWPKEENLKIISKSTLYVLNKEEAVAILGEINDEKELLNKFIEAGAKNVIITDGMNGSNACDGQNCYHLDIVKVDTLDMTGAGDAYLSGVIGALANDENLSQAMIWGAINGAAVVQKLGAQEGLLSVSQIKEKQKEIAIKVIDL